MFEPKPITFENHQVARIGLQATLWFSPDTRDVIWPAIWQLAANFANQHGPYLLWWSSSAIGDIRRSSAVDLDVNERKLALDAEDKLYDATHLFADHAFPSICPPLPDEVTDIAMGHGDNIEDAWQVALPLLFYANLPGKGSALGGFVRIHWPWVVGASPERLAVAEKFIHAAANALQPLHGTVGWGVHLPLRPGFFAWELDAAISLYPWIEHYPGLDCYEPLEMQRALTTQMLTPNWLTFVHDKLLDKIGGQNAVSAKLAKQAELSKEDWGLCIKAGKTAPLAAIDTKGQPAAEIESLRHVADVLKPLRVEHAPNHCISPPPNGYADRPAWAAACDQYLTRFTTS